MIKHFSPNDYVVEPANVQILRSVTSINVANYPREVVLPPSECSDSSMYGVPITFIEDYVMANNVVGNTIAGITGDVNLIPGWNCTTSISNNEVTITGEVGAGTALYGEQPSEVAVTEEEEAILDSGQYLSRGPKCRDLVSSINGLHERAIGLSSGSGIDMEKEDGTITIKMVNHSKGDKCSMPECLVPSTPRQD